MTGSARGPVEAELAQNPYICFAELIYHLDRRFEQQGSQYDAHRRFYEARQQSTETLNEWADRVRKLGTLAVLNPQFEREAVMAQFCRGLVDRMAGRIVAMQTHAYRNLMEAVEAVRIFQEGGSEPQDSAASRRRPNIGEVEIGDLLDEDELDIMAVQSGRRPWRGGPSPRTAPRTDSKPTPTEQRPVTDVDKVLKELVAAILAGMEKLGAQISETNRRRPRSGKCYNCQDPGHFQADCPLPRAPQTSPLNGKGAESERSAEVRPEQK